MVPGVRKGRAVSERRTFKTFILNFVSLSSLALGDNAQYIFHTRGKTFTSSIDGRKNVDMFRRRGKLFTASTGKNGVFFLSHGEENVHIFCLHPSHTEEKLYRQETIRLCLSQSKRETFTSMQTGSRRFHLSLRQERHLHLSQTIKRYLHFFSQTWKQTFTS